LLTVPETECAQELVDAGVRLLQYRNKRAPARELLESSTKLVSLLAPLKVSVVVNDRADLEQFQRAAASSADYIAVGPIFATGTKSNPDPVVGTEFIRKARLLTDKPIVAIGGITLERAPEIIEAGADSVAVISDILSAPAPGMRARQYIDLLGAANHTAAG
jgi:thiamine-phosphate pyrophosphorylase